MRLFALVLVSTLAAVTTATAQVAGGCPVTGSSSVTMISQRGMVIGSVPRTPVRIPYSLVQMHTQVQTLSNGVQITSRQEMREWHDADGRTRTEARIERNGEMELQSASINDPVARENIILYPRAHVAQVTRYPEPHVTASQPRPIDKAFNEAMKAEFQPQPQRTPPHENKTEELGTTVILGECAQGTRWTNIVPAGELGNDGEIRAVQENWFSPRLGIQLRFVLDDPRMGHIENEVTELDLENPDPSVFQPPPDYHVFDLTRDPANP